MLILLVCFTFNMVAVDPNIALSWNGNDTGLDVMKQLSTAVY